MTDQPLRDREDAEPAGEPAAEQTDAQVAEAREGNEGEAQADE